MENKIYNESRKDISYTAAFLIGVLAILLFGTSYAWYSFTNANIDVAGTTSSWCDGLDVSVTQNKNINTTSGSPVDDYLTEAEYSEIVVTNNENFAVTIDLSLINIDIDAELKNTYFKYALLEGSTVLGTGNFSNVEVGDASALNMATGLSIPGKGSKTYKLYIYIEESGSSQDSMQDKNFSGVVKVTVNSDWCGVQITGTLYSKISESAVMDNTSSTFVLADTGIDFGEISSDINGRGVYMLSSTSSDEYPIYYYRGAVTDNNVIFGGFCWKIVRTTDTGGIKMIYNGTPSSGTCNNTGENSQIGTSAFNTNANDNAYVGYMFGSTSASTYNATHTNTNSSTIKGVIDSWYSTNLNTYTSYIEDTVYCNDRSIYSGKGYGTNETYYGEYGRVDLNNNPSLVCINANDKFTKSTSIGNGKLTYPVGLLTADEAILAGGYYNYSDGVNNYYLNTGVKYWLLTPYSHSSSVSFGLYVDFSSMDLNDDDVNTVLGVRPVISLIPGITITSGTGTVNDPYVIAS